MHSYTISIQMRGSSKSTPAVSVRANSPEHAYKAASQIAETIYEAAVRPEGPEFSVSVCDQYFELYHFQNFDNEEN